jgi:hypothetical protein
MRAHPIAALAALSLAACNDTSAPAPPPTASETEVPPREARSPIEPPSQGETTAAAAIPAAIQGRWGLGPNDCDPSRSDAKGLLTIGPDSLTFYESVGELRDIRERDDSRIRASFAFTGEGMSWTRDEALRVEDGGKALIRQEYGEDGPPGPLRYSRCP